MLNAYDTAGLIEPGQTRPDADASLDRYMRPQ